MKGLLLKDMYQLLRIVGRYLVFILILLVINLFTDAVFFNIYLPVMAGMIVVSLYSLDEKAKWEQYSLTLPVTRFEIVAEKYILCLIINLAATVLLFLSLGVYQFFSGTLNPAALIWRTALMLALGIFPFAFSMPMMFGYGSEEGRLLAICATVLGVLPIVVIAMGTNLAISENPPSYVSAIVLIAVTALIYALSLAVSVLLYKNREL